MQALTIAVLIQVTLYLACSVQGTKRPIIGVFTQPIVPINTSNITSFPNGEYIPSSYVKWIESSGGRVVPISYTASFSWLEMTLPQMNGLVFPGGMAPLNDRIEYAYKKAIKYNDQGIHYPIWGTCLGLQWLLMLTSENDTILDGNLDAFNLSLPLNFTLESATSRLYSHAPRKILRCLREKPITMNSHKFGIGISKWYQTEKISSFYRMLSTNFDRQGFEFVSSMEAIKYPFYGVQFHPEKNIFSYGEYENGVAFEDIDHSMEAIEAGQYFGNFFLQEARQNENYFFDPVMERQALIYNYQTSNLFFPFITEVYLFDVEHPMVANITTTSTAHHAAMDFLKSKINKMTTW